MNTFLNIFSEHGDLSFRMKLRQLYGYKVIEDFKTAMDKTQKTPLQKRILYRGYNEQYNAWLSPDKKRLSKSHIFTTMTVI